jgi:hypothetical protein
MKRTGVIVALTLMVICIIASLSISHVEGFMRNEDMYTIRHNTCEEVRNYCTYAEPLLCGAEGRGSGGGEGEA